MFKQAYMYLAVRDAFIAKADYYGGTRIDGRGDELIDSSAQSAALCCMFLQSAYFQAKSAGIKSAVSNVAYWGALSLRPAFHALLRSFFENILMAQAQGAPPVYALSGFKRDKLELMDELNERGALDPVLSRLNGGKSTGPLFNEQKTGFYEYIPDNPISVDFPEYDSLWDYVSGRCIVSPTSWVIPTCGYTLGELEKSGLLNGLACRLSRVCAYCGLTGDGRQYIWVYRCADPVRRYREDLTPGLENGI